MSGLLMQQPSHAGGFLEKGKDSGVTHKHGGYFYSIGLPDGGVAALRGIIGSIRNAEVIQGIMMQAVAHDILITINNLSMLKENEIKDTGFYTKKIDAPGESADDARKDTVALQAVQQAYNAKEQSLTTTQNQQTQLQQALAENIMNLIQNLAALASIFQGAAS